ncbi:MAG TPA: hypothetical protein PKL78_05235 [Anaerolineales bacterium]|nr:hypothetical protein [Anaerolineales bacterium]HNN12939.1 hypothetical protein [Anaerolineales bacterium]HNO31021.1 hypothetical protein [Anaerolineales bacterium]
MKFDLGEVLTRIWKIGWNHKVLWLWQMIPGALAIVFLPVSFLINPAFPMLMGKDPDPYLTSPWMPFVFLGVVFVFMVPTVFLGVLAQLTATWGAAKVERGAESLGFMDLFHDVKPYYWRVFGLYAIFLGAWMVIWFGFVFVTMAGSIVTMGLASLCIFPIMLLAIPVMIVGYSALELAQAAVVVEDLGVVDSISRAWHLFRANWLGVTVVIVLLYFLMYIISMVVTLPIMFPMMMLMPALAGTQMSSSVLVGAVVAGVFLLFFAISILSQAVLMTFFKISWVVLYLRIRGGEDTPAVEPSAMEKI